jgi:hypothetical protein
VRSLDLLPGGTLDLGNGAFVIDYDGPASPLATVIARARDGRNGGDWRGAGITASAAKTDPRGAVGVASDGELFGPGGGSFLGTPVDGSAVLARYTLLGDATLDGSVNFVDLVRLAQNYNATVSTTPGSWWARGDFDYDGRVSFSDLVRLAQNYNASLPAGPIPGAAAGFDAEVAAAFAVVPEPGGAAAVGLLAVAVFSVRGRRPASGTVCSAGG